MRMFTPLPWVLILVACQHNSGPSPVENFVAMVDAEAAVQQLQYQQQQADRASLARLAQNACVRESDSLNVLYSPSGSVIYRGGPASMSELVWLSPSGTAQQVDAFTSNQGTYIAFTPQAIYVSQPATGHSTKFLRSRQAAARVTRPSSERPPVAPYGSSATLPSAARESGHFNTLQAIPQETPTSPSTEV